MNLQPIFERTLHERELARSGDSILLALSGGPDSTLLAHLFASIRSAWALELHALHVNYGLRGEESDEDEAFVRDLCGGLGLPLSVRSASPLETLPGESLQMAARRIRYALLEEERARSGAGRIATGHTRDDRAETLLLNLFRGAGARGLRSIPYRRDRVIRPLLDVSRAEIEAFLAERSLPFRTDRSNLETDFDRNKIRLELLPHAERLLGRPVRGPIARAAEILAETEAYLAAEGARWIRENARTAGEATDLCAGALAALPRALGREVVRAMVRGGPDPSASIGSERVERVLRLARRAAGGRVLLPGGREARREGERIRFAPREETLPPFLAPLDVPGETLLPDGRRVVARLLDAREAGDDAPASRQRARLDHDRVRPPLVVRSRLPGDRLRPLGSPGERKLQDLLVDRKIPRSERDTIPLMADEDGILWVAGVEIAERAKIAASTRVILEVALFPPRYDTEGAGEGLPRGEAPGHGTFV